VPLNLANFAGGSAPGSAAAAPDDEDEEQDDEESSQSSSENLGCTRCKEKSSELLILHMGNQSGLQCFFWFLVLTLQQLRKKQKPAVANTRKQKGRRRTKRKTRRATKRRRRKDRIQHITLWYIKPTKSQ
jgi:hypothetical protein